MLGANNKNNSTNIKVFIRDLLQKEEIDETDLMVIEDNQNTKFCLVRDFIKSIIKDDDLPANYRIYSSHKVQEMINEINTTVDVGIGGIQYLVQELDKKKVNIEDMEAMRNALIAEINLRADQTAILEILGTKRDKDQKFTAADFDTSSDEYKLKLEHFSEEVIKQMTGGVPIPSNRPPKGGWVTEDIADRAIKFSKLDDDYRFGGHFTEGFIDEFVKDGIYTLGPKIIGLPKDENENGKQIRLLTVETTEDYIKQKVEYLNDTKYRPIYRRVCNLNRLRVTPFIRVEEINEKFKVHRGLLADDYNNCGIISDCDIFSIDKEGHYITDNTVTNLPTKDTYEVSISKFGDRVIYQACNIGNNRCDIYQCMKYYTIAMNPVTTQWYNISSYARSKFEGKMVHLFGDGIIYGLGSDDIVNKSISALLYSKYGMRVVNNALGDATIGAYDDDRLKEMNLPTQISTSVLDNADFAVIMMGTHDWDSSKAIIGNNTSDTDSTLKGALNLSIQNILDKNAYTKIILFTPIFRSRIKIGDGKNSDQYQRNDLYLSDIATAIEEIAEYNHLPCVNLYKTSGINRYNSTAYLKDGLYLNDIGQELIADKIMNAMNLYY